MGSDRTGEPQAARAPRPAVNPGSSRRAGRTRPATAARFLLRSLSKRGASFLLALLAITVGATVTATMLDLKADLGAKMSKELRRYGPNLLVRPAGGQGSGSVPATLDEASVRTIPSSSLLLIAAGTVGADRAPGAGEPAAESTPAISATRSDLSAVAATIVGAEFDTLGQIYPSWRVEGAWPRETPGGGASATATAPSAPENHAQGTSPSPRAGTNSREESSSGPRGSGLPGSCLVGVSLARRAGLATGARALVRAGTGGEPLSLVVAGVLSTGEAEDDEIFVPLRLLQRATGLAGRVSIAALSIDGGAEAVQQAASEIEREIAGVSALPLRQVAAAQGSLLARLDLMMLLLTAVVLVLSGLCLVTTLMSIVVEREREIGLMRSIGAGDGEILRIFLGEVGLLGLLGAAIGLLLGAASARLIGRSLFGAAIEARAAVVPFVLAASLLLCLIAVFVPLRRALRIQPAAALRGD